MTLTSFGDVGNEGGCTHAGQGIHGNCIISTPSYCDSKSALGNVFESESKQVVMAKTAKIRISQYVAKDCQGIWKVVQVELWAPRRCARTAKVEAAGPFYWGNLQPHQRPIKGNGRLWACMGRRMVREQLPTDRQLRSGDRAVVLSLLCGDKPTRQSQKTATTLSVSVEKKRLDVRSFCYCFCCFPWFLTRN